MLKPETIALIATAAAYLLAAARLFNIAKPLYSWIPAKAQPVVIALAAGLPQLAEALIGVTTKEQLFAAVGSAVVAFLVAVKGAPPSPPGDSPAVGAVPLSVRPPGGFDAELRAWPGVALACLLALACNPRRPPCDESKLRAVDAAFLKRVAAECLEYPSADACPAYPALKADHRRELREVCPQ